MATLLDHATELIRQVWRFDHSADALLTQYTQAHPKLGARDRAQLADVLYAALRHRLRWEALAKTAPAGTSAARALAILGAVVAARPHAAPPGAAHGAPNPLATQPSFPFNFQLSNEEHSWLTAALVDVAAPTPTGAPLTGSLPPHAWHGLPAWLWDALMPTLGADELAALAASLNQGATLDLRVNLLKAKRTELLKQLLASGLPAEATTLSPWGVRLAGKPSLKPLSAYQDGRVEVQDEGSQLLAWLLDARRGEVVVDFCAGAGGKTLALGAMMRNQGRVYAFDNSAHRLEALKPRLARSGLNIVYPMAIAHEQDERVLRLASKVDRVLVDAPCSGLGTLRRHPDLKWRQTPATVQELIRTQTRILEAAQRLVKPGGRLVYATCSLLPAENAGVAEAFTQSHPEFSPLAVEPLVRKLDLPASVPSPAHGPYLQLWPHRHGTDGFFAAVWERRR